MTEQTDQAILDQIHQLMVEEHELSQANVGGGGAPGVADRLGEVDVEIDRLWDLIRQRRARRRAGEDPDGASLRPAGTVEGYQQ